MATAAAQSSSTLPPGWDESTTTSGQTFWTNSSTRIKTYYNPNNPNPHPDGFAPIPLEGASLPSGWEILGRTVDGRNDIVYSNHNTHTSTHVDPRVDPLPTGWEAGRDSSGRTFWMNSGEGLKTYYDPRAENLYPGGFESVRVEGGELPEGWEVVGKMMDGELVVSYLDHNTHSSTSVDPRS